jgi:hypothetical protein
MRASRALNIKKLAPEVRITIAVEYCAGGRHSHRLPDAATVKADPAKEI